MAAISPVVSTTSNDDTLVTWTGVTEADTFVVYDISRTFKSITLQIGGTFGGATVVAHGSLDNSVFAGLLDGSGSALSVTAASVKEVKSSALYIKPVASGGTAQSLTVKMLIRR